MVRLKITHEKKEESNLNSGNFNLKNTVIGEMVCSMCQGSGVTKCKIKAKVIDGGWFKSLYNNVHCETLCRCSNCSGNGRLNIISFEKNSLTDENIFIELNKENQKYIQRKCRE